MKILQYGMVLGIWLLLTAGAAAQAIYQSEVRYRIPIGSGDAEVSVGDSTKKKQWWGPAHMAVTGSGTLYLADIGNHRVKAFDPQGRLLLQTEILAQGPQSLGLDFFRNIYVLDGPRTLVEFSPSGQRIYAMVIPRNIPDLQCLFPVFDDAICARTGPQVLSVFSQKKNPQEELEGDCKDDLPGNLCSGRRLVVSFHERGKWNYLFAATTLGKRAMESYPLVMQPQTVQWLNGMHADPARVEWHVDADQYAYLIVLLKRRQPVTLGKQSAVTEDVYIVVFDKFGRQAATLQFPAAPFPMVSPITIDEDGNLYHLVVQGNMVEVVCERLLLPHAVAEQQLLDPTPPPVIILLAGIGLIAFALLYAGYALIKHKSDKTTSALE